MDTSDDALVLEYEVGLLSSYMLPTWTGEVLVRETVNPPMFYSVYAPQTDGTEDWLVNYFTMEFAEAVAAELRKLRRDDTPAASGTMSVFTH